MANTNQLATAICRLVEVSQAPVPVTFANHSVEEAAAIIGAVVEKCHSEGIILGQVCVDKELALELGLIDGVALPHGGQPVITIEGGLGRNVLFKRVL